MSLHLHSLDYCDDVVNRHVVLFYRGGGQYTVDFLFRCGVSPFPCSCYPFPLLALGLVKEDLEFFPCILVGGLTPSLPDVFVEFRRLFQKGDTS